MQAVSAEAERDLPRMETKISPDSYSMAASTSKCKLVISGVMGRVYGIPFQNFLFALYAPGVLTIRSARPSI